MIQPDRVVRTICSYCGVGCGIFLHVKEDAIFRITGDFNSPVNHGSLCVKGRFGSDYIHAPDRLRHPLLRTDSGLQPADWDTALNHTVDRLISIRHEYGPQSIAFLSSAKCTNEENYLLQKIARTVIGTNNVDHCARL